MGSTNLRKSLEFKMAHWMAEVSELADQQRQRGHHLRHVLDCAATIMKEIDPDWTPEQIQPVTKNARKAYFVPGQLTKDTLDILKASSKPMTSRSIALAILSHSNLRGSDMDALAVQKITNAVDSVLRAKQRGGFVTHDGLYGRKWRLVAKFKLSGVP